MHTRLLLGLYIKIEAYAWNFNHCSWIPATLIYVNHVQTPWSSTHSWSDLGSVPINLQHHNGLYFVDDELEPQLVIRTFQSAMSHLISLSSAHPLLHSDGYCSVSPTNWPQQWTRSYPLWPQSIFRPRDTPVVSQYKFRAVSDLMSRSYRSGRTGCMKLNSPSNFSW